ncbi:F/Y rich carboxy-terminal protein, partial [Trifolium medium]|nr:F/Y rich carboxy-terminal protein [Trifolium medium]
MVTEDAYGEQGEKIHKPNTGPRSNSYNTEHMKSIVLDSFEYSQCEDLKNSETLSFDIAEVDKSSFSKEMCCPKSQEQLPGDLPNGPSTCCASELEFKNRPPDYDACVPDSVLDDMSPPDVCIPDSVLDDMSPAHDSFNSLQNGLSAGQDFTGENTQDEAVGKTGNVKRMMMSSSQSPNIVYTRRKRRNSVTLQGNRFSVKSTECDKIELGTRQMHTARDAVPPSKTIQTKNDKLCEPDDSASLLLETLQAHSDIPDVQSNLAELNHSSQNPNPLSCENKCSGSKEAQFVSEPIVQRNQELKNNLNSNVKFVGCYMHPMPVSSLLLKTTEDEIHICVLCGLTGQHRTLFTYKVAIKGPNFGCPSVMAHTPIMLPDPTYNFMGETILERTGVELTPDGQYIVLIGSIKTPNCREGKIDCCCSTCTSVCSEKNALKIVHVESGYVSVLATLEAVEDSHCILVCEANRLVSVGESGRLQVWVMNSTW